VKTKISIPQIPIFLHPKQKDKLRLKPFYIPIENKDFHTSDFNLSGYLAKKKASIETFLNSSENKDFQTSDSIHTNLPGYLAKR